MLFEKAVVHVGIDVDAHGQHGHSSVSQAALHTDQGRISSTQGGHQVAQKFNTTTLPRNWRKVTVRSESCTVKSVRCCQYARGASRCSSQTAEAGRQAKAEEERPHGPMIQHSFPEVKRSRNRVVPQFE